MANAYVRSSGIVKVGNRWGVCINGKVVEGGIANEEAARSACLWWQINFREEEPTGEEDDELLGQGRR